MQRRKSVSNAIEHKIAEITEQIRHKQNDKRNSILIHLNDSTYQTISYILSKVFRSKDENILIPEYLYLLLSQREFDRYSRFNSWGSARETFDWSEMCRVQIPLPPIQIQQKIVDLYNCYEECKRIATAAREKIKNLCPALVQKAAHSL